ncbi:MAG: hypothetical protein Q9159_000482 [Coniocarpon cinnabarinum]
MKVVVIGAGPVGSLAALYAAKRGHDVQVYESRSDIRHPSQSTPSLNKSINLALSHRGIHALEATQCPHLLSRILSNTIPMRGRMVHSRSATGSLRADSQTYDAHGRFIRAADRGELNKALLDELDGFENVQMHFGFKIVRVEEENGSAVVEERGGNGEERSVEFDLLIGADGAHSTVRSALSKLTRLDFSQEYVDTMWCEFSIAPLSTSAPDGFSLDSASPSATSTADLKSAATYAASESRSNEPRFALHPHHLHIWPTPTHSSEPCMFIAIPSADGTFVCTLFASSATFTALTQDPSTIPQFFTDNFPGVTDILIPADELSAMFERNPHESLVSIRCRPHHWVAAASTMGEKRGELVEVKDGERQRGVVILGDAAHAMVPFYGQGMNAGLEDVRVLFSILDNQTLSSPPPFHSVDTKSRPPMPPSDPHLRGALAKYSDVRVPAAHSIVSLSLQNFHEMRAGVTSRTYRLRKAVEEKLSVYAPWTGFETQYARVSFSDQSYDAVIASVEAQGRILRAVGYFFVVGEWCVLSWQFWTGRWTWGRCD